MNIRLIWGMLKHRKMSAAELAKHLGISTTTVYRKLWGNEEFTAKEIRIMRKVLKLSYGEIIRIFFYDD